MAIHADKISKNITDKVVVPLLKNKSEPTFQLVDNRHKKIETKTDQKTINNNPQVKQLKFAEEKNNTQPIAQLKVIQLVKWEKRDPDAKLSPQDQAAYAAHIGLRHSHISHGSNYVPSMRDLDASLQQQQQMAAEQQTARLAKTKKK